MRHTSRRSIRSQRRRKTWNGSQWGLNGQNLWNNAVTPQIGIIQNAWHKIPSGIYNTLSDSTEDPDYTLMRSLVSWSMGWKMDAVTGGPTYINYRWCFGLIAWDYPFETAIPVAQQPNPGFDDQLDWLYLAAHNDVFIATASVAPAVAYSAPRFDKEFDSRSRRKLPDGTGILACWALYLDFSFRAVNQNVQWTFGENTRSLYALP